MIIDDFIGQIYGDFMILEYNKESSTSQKETIFKCQCIKCGNIINKRKRDFIKGERITCKVCNSMDNINSMIGQTFGLLTVVEYDEQLSNLSKKAMYKCICNGKCGGETVYASAFDLKNGIVNSCGSEYPITHSKNAIPMIGKEFNGLKVVDVDEFSSAAHKGRDLWYICECEKGHRSSHNGALLRKNTEECPFCHPKMKGKYSKKGMAKLDLTGKRFGGLTVLNEVCTEWGERKWYCSCTFPGETKPHAWLTATTEELVSGQKFGCESCMYRSDMEIAEKYYKHYFSRISNMFYSQIKFPCTDPYHPAYKYFGANNVKCMYENMEDFYYDYMIDFGIAENRYNIYTLVPDIIDVEGNFEKGNIRFVNSETRDINHKPIDMYYALYNQLWTSEMLSIFAAKFLEFNIDPWFIDERIRNGQSVIEALHFDYNGNQINQLPVLDYYKLRRIHKISQGLDSDDVDYLFNNTPYEVFPKDKLMVVRFNKMLRESGQI